jgi:sterol desaturase/sphingolipid hydroxylase (fatty acid hydroxylase superfamily)
MSGLARVIERVMISPVNYWAGFALDGGVAAVTIVAGASATSAGAPALVLALAVGAAFYSLLEYAVHRWLYHRWPTIVRRIHGHHHADVRLLQGAPWFVTLGVAAVHGALAALLVDRGLAAVFAGTVLAGYFAQSVVHAQLHRGRRAPRWLGRLRRHHLAHHRHDDGNYGITTTVWDRVLGTSRPAGARSR